MTHKVEEYARDITAGKWTLSPECGMSLRDWFAGQVIAALILRADPSGMVKDARDRAERAYLYADALLGVRDEPR